MTRPSPIVGQLLNSPWAITPGSATALASEFAERLAVEPMRRAPAVVLEARRRGRAGLASERIGKVLKVSVSGKLVNRCHGLDVEPGFVDYNALRSALRSAAADAATDSILLDMSSPGGEAAGAVETAETVREIAASKRIIAHVGANATGAAWLIAAGACEIVSAPSATLGGLVVICLRSAVGSPSKLRLIDALDAAALDGVERALALRLGDAQTSIAAAAARLRPAIGKLPGRDLRQVFLGAQAVECGLADRLGSGEQALEIARDGGSPMAAGASALTDANSREPLVARSATRLVSDDAAELATLAAEVAAGGKAERERMVAIIESPAGKLRPVAALNFALKTEMSAEIAISALGVMPEETSGRPRYSQSWTSTLPRSGGADERRHK